MEKFRRYIRVKSEDLINAIWSPKLEEVYKATDSEIIVEEDRSCVQISLVSSSQTWFKYKLRDRRFDGPGWRATPLVNWQYDGAKDFFPSPAVEESIYCLDPRYPLTSVFTEEIANFVKNPFEALPHESPNEDNLREWLRKWQSIFSSENILYPGYFLAERISGVCSKIHKNVLLLLKACGYEYLTAIPTWWHTACIYEHLGFKYLYYEDELRIKAIRDKLASEKNGTEHFRRSSSWIVMLQFWAEMVISCGLKLEDFDVSKDHILRNENGEILTFPFSPDNNLWLHHKVQM